MSSSSKTRPLLAVAGLLSALVVALLVYAATNDARGGRGGDGSGGPVGLPDANTVSQSQPGPRTTLVPPPRLPQRSAEDVADTTVLWPLQIELDLVRAAYLPTEEGVRPIGTGRTARLSGQITDANDQGARAEVRFVEGPNEGVVLTCDATGKFGSTDLYPGLSIVEVRGKNVLGSRREVRLRQGRESLLNIGYGRPGTVFGQVVDPQGNGVEGAKVIVDGTRVYSGVEGEFYLPSVAGGSVLCEVEHPGFASLRQVYNITAGRVVPKERMRFALQPAASMTISVPDKIGGPGPVLVMLLPAQERVERKFPWHTVNPIEVWPGSPVTVEGLPTAPARVLAFRPGAIAPEKVVNLRAGRDLGITIPLKAAPRITGHVKIDGKPAASARVRLEAPDRVQATLSYFKKPQYFLETEVFPPLPVASQEVVANRDGYFSLTAWSNVTPVRYLEVRSADNRYWAGRLVHPDETSLEIELEEATLGNSTLELEFPNRWQGLPYELSINGTPFDPGVVPAHDTLAIQDLLAGTWRIRARWRTQEVQPEKMIELDDGRNELSVDLIEAAIEGQTEEQWKRAGREFPFPGR